MNYWLNDCDRARIELDMYSDDFLQQFEESNFFKTCKKTVAGKLKWNDWVDCSASCGGGIQRKHANSCVPNYAVCYDIQILQRDCNQQACLELPSMYVPGRM